MRFYDVVIMWSHSDLFIIVVINAYLLSKCVEWNDGKMLKKQLKSIHPKKKSDIIYSCMAFILMLIKIYWWLQQRPQFASSLSLYVYLWLCIRLR